MNFSKSYSTILILLFLFNSYLFPQRISNSIIKEFSFGKAYYLGEVKLPSNLLKYSGKALFNKNGVYFSISKEYSSESIEKLFSSNEILELYISNPIIKINEGGYRVISIEKDDKIFNKKIGLSNFKLSHLLMVDGIYNNSVFLTDFHVSDDVMLQKTEFNESVFLASSDFNSNAKKEKPDLSYYIITNQLKKPTFDIVKIKANKDFSFTDCRFPYLTISNSEFKDHCNFFGCEFTEDIEFIKTNVNKGISFHRSKINGRLSFNDVKTNGIRFDEVEIESDLIFNRVKILNDIYFQNAKLKNGCDLRRCDLDSLKNIYLEGIEFPIGKFFIDWEKIKYKDNAIVSIDTSGSKDKEDNFKRLQAIYEILINNYEAQGNKISVDDVKYELEIRRQELLGGISHWVYGKILGYGYKPFRYLLYLVIPLILIFAFILYVYHYEIVYELLKPSYSNKTQMFKLEKGKYLKNNFIISDGYVNKFKIPKIAVLWHCLFMSSSLLLGLRFKKDWINYKENKFLILASIEWLIGIGLYVGFALLVKTFRFEFLKGIFGL